jgi:hypothetical protein
MLWWRVHEPDAPELTPGPALTQAFDFGDEVGERAREQFPGGVLVAEGPWSIQRAVAATAAALRAGMPAIFEASLEAGGIFVAIDVLERLQEGYGLVEVKSARSVRAHHLADVAIQVYVARAAGLDVRKAEVMHLAAGDEAAELAFARVDVTADVERLLCDIPRQVEAQRVALSGPLPVAVAGPHCHAPFQCAFTQRCQQ